MPVARLKPFVLSSGGNDESLNFGEPTIRVPYTSKSEKITTTMEVKEIEVSPSSMRDKEVEVTPSMEDKEIGVSPSSMEDKEIGVSPSSMGDKDIEVTPSMEDMKIEVTPSMEDKEIEVTPFSGAIKEKSCELSMENVTFHRILGQGACGKVILASHPATSNKLAVKFIKKRKVLNDGVHSISTEVDVLQQTGGSPYITHLYGAFQTKVSVLSSSERRSHTALCAYFFLHKGK